MLSLIRLYVYIKSKLAENVEWDEEAYKQLYPDFPFTRQFHGLAHFLTTYDAKKETSWACWKGKWYKYCEHPQPQIPPWKELIA